MSYALSAVECRVLGALMEKEMATPEYYPLSLNALVNACNQKSNRDPVMALDEDSVSDALDELRHRGLAAVRSGAESRVPKYLQRITETLNLGNRESALLCVLLLRGAQTPGELRSRSQNLYAFDDLEAVESCLRRMMEMPSGSLVELLPKQAGYKEQRYTHLLGDPALRAILSAETPAQPATPGSPLSARVEQLEREIQQLRAEWEAFRRGFESS